MEKARLLLAVYHEILRDGIEIILSEEENYTIANSAKLWEDLAPLMKENPYDILLLDLDTPDLQINFALNQIKDLNPDIKILTLSGPCNKYKIKEVLKAGVTGFIFKGRGKKELQVAIDIIAGGGQYLCEDTIKVLLDENIQVDGPVDNLTEREVEILNLICKEHTNKKISEMLHISKRTVDAHRRNLMQKTGADNTAGLVKYAIRNDICTP